MHTRDSYTDRSACLRKKASKRMQAKGVDVGCGDFAENLTTEGINLVSLPLGTRLAVGPGSVLRITKSARNATAGAAYSSSRGLHHAKGRNICGGPH
jgi:hypothetical protein